MSFIIHLGIYFSRLADHGFIEIFIIYKNNLRSGGLIGFYPKFSRGKSLTGTQVAVSLVCTEAMGQKIVGRCHQHLFVVIDGWNAALLFWWRCLGNVNGKVPRCKFPDKLSAYAAGCGETIRMVGYHGTSRVPFLALANALGQSTPLRTVSGRKGRVLDVATRVDLTAFGPEGGSHLEFAVGYIGAPPGGKGGH